MCNRERAAMRGGDGSLAIFAGGPLNPDAPAAGAPFGAAPLFGSAAGLTRAPLTAPQPAPTAADTAASATAAAAASIARPSADEPDADRADAEPDNGSRRRKLWELSTQSHCPIVGVCLPMPALRAVMRKALGRELDGDDYDLHCSAVSQSANRSPIADRLQRELDQRHAAAIRQAARIKTGEALLEWWHDERFGADVSGALWATLTHPRCRATIEDKVLRDIHMQQHQVGAAQRVDARRLNELSEENAVLTQELAAVQARTNRLVAEKSALAERQAADLVQLRAALIGKDNVIAELRADLDELEATLPGLRSRIEQARRIESQLARIHELERELVQTRHKLQNLQERQEEPAPSAAVAEPAADGDAEMAAEPAPLPEVLADKAVLCVGGRPASVPFYRFLIERSGGRFLHHDGGQEDNSARLDASLSAADVVICHTGCLSHGAYWRVKDHCKRTGTRFLFVDNPSRASLQRALASLTAPARSQPATADASTAERAGS